VRLLAQLQARRLAATTTTQRERIVPLLLGLVVFAASIWVPLSYDEAYWLSLTRRFGQGARLYWTAVDHKTPIWLALVHLIDLMPGPFHLARALLVVSIGVTCYLILRRHYQLSVGAALVVASLLLVINHAVLTIELVGALLLLTVVTNMRTRPVSSIVAALAGSWLDIRLHLATALCFAFAGLDPRQRRVGVVAVLALGSSGLLILLWDELRFGVLTFAAASRSYAEFPTWAPFVLPLVALAPLLPLVTPESLRQHWLVIVAASTIPVVSIYPYLRYWAYPALLLGTTARNTQPVRRLALSALLLVLPALIAYPIAWNDRTTFEQYRKAADGVEKLLGPEGSFLPFDMNPHLAAMLPERTDIRSGNVMYAATPTEREAVYRADLLELLDRTDSVITPVGQLETRLAQPRLDDLRQEFADIVEDFECQRIVEHLAVYLRRCSSG